MPSLTIREWYNRLREPYRSEAIGNYVAEHGSSSMDDTQCPSLYEAVNSFTWIHSAEGSRYWRRIANHLAENKNDKTYVVTSIYRDRVSPEWSNSLTDIASHLRSTLDVSDEHGIEVCCVSRDPIFDSAKLCNYFHKGILNHSSGPTIQIHQGKNRRLSNYHIYYRDGIRIIFRVIKPRGTTQSISDPLKATLNEYKNYISDES